MVGRKISYIFIILTVQRDQNHLPSIRPPDPIHVSKLKFPLAAFSSSKGVTRFMPLHTNPPRAERCWTFKSIERIPSSFSDKSLSFPGSRAVVNAWTHAMDIYTHIHTLWYGKQLPRQHVCTWATSRNFRMKNGPQTIAPHYRL